MSTETTERWEGTPPRGGGGRGEGAGRRGGGEAPGAGPPSPPRRGMVGETEVSAKPRRRRFSPEYKLQIVEAGAQCRGEGEVGALLRREGLYSSHLVTWRREALAGLQERKRGRKPEPA